MGWTNTIPFPFIVVDPSTGSPIFIIDSTGAHLLSQDTGIDLTQTGGSPPPASIVFKDLSGGGAEPAIINSQVIDDAMSIDLSSGVGSGSASSAIFMNAVQLVLSYEDTFAPNFGLSRLYFHADGIFTEGNYLSVLNEGWQAPSFQNGWGNLGGTNEVAGFRLFADGWVRFRGTIIGGTKTDGTVLFNIPAAYRPAKDKVMPFALISSGATSPAIQLRVSASTGNVTVFGVSTTGTGNLSMEHSGYSLIT